MCKSAGKRFVLLAVIAVVLPLASITTPASSSSLAQRIEDAANSWTANGYVGNLALTRTGTLYVTGSFTKIGIRAGSRVARNGAAALDTRSGLVQTWSPNPDEPVFGLAVSPSGRVVYAAGGFTRIGDKHRPGLAALDARTGDVTPWRPLGIEIGQQAVVTDLYESRVYVAGNSGILAFDSSTGKRLWRSVVPYCCSSAITISSDGNFLFASGIQKAKPGGSSHYVLVSLRARDGRMRWKFEGGVVYALLLSDDGRTLYVGGHFHEMRGFARHDLAALDGATGEMKRWAPRPAGYVALEDDEGVFALALGEQGAVVYVAGDFTSIDGRRRNSLAAVSARSGKILDWNPKPSTGIIESLAVSSDRKTVYFPEWIAGQAPFRAIRAVTGARP